MNQRHIPIAAAFAVLVLSGSPCTRLAAQTALIAPSQAVWENDRLRVDRMSLAPGETLTGDSRGGSVVVFLTADLDGRMPPAEAAWRGPGAVTMENRGRARFEALVINFKSRAPLPSGVTPPEAARTAGTVTQMAGYGGIQGPGVDARNLIRNDHVTVTKQRYPLGSSAHFDPVHFHPQDAVVIYLRGGYTWPTSWLSGPERVRRGDVRVVPGNVIHTVGNAGSDPLEFLLIMPT